MLVGAVWSAVPATLKVTRGVSEVVSTIMLNYVALAIIGWSLTNYLQDNDPNSLQLKTKLLPKSGRIPGLTWLPEKLGFNVPPGSSLYGFLPIAILVGVAFWIIVWKTRFGYDLRASGQNPSAARASGVSPRAMVFRTMILSGIFAGLVGMPDLLGFSHQYNLDFRGDYGFNGIGVALLGRNHPGGVAIGALLFGFLERSAQILDLEGIPKEIVAIMKGIIIISVVVAYEVVGRLVRAQEARHAASAARSSDAGTGTTQVAPA
jgi:simple sugar transport system permease protein